MRTVQPLSTGCVRGGNEGRGRELGSLEKPQSTQPLFPPGVECEGWETASVSVCMSRVCHGELRPRVAADSP